MDFTALRKLSQVRLPLLGDSEPSASPATWASAIPCRNILSLWCFNWDLRGRVNILNGSSSEYLFPNKFGKPLTTRTIENIVKKYTEKKEIKSKVTPHTLRHTYATDLLNNGADIRSVGELLGHESLSTTQIYTHVTSDRLKSVYSKTHPRAKK